MPTVPVYDPATGTIHVHRRTGVTVLVGWESPTPPQLKIGVAGVTKVDRPLVTAGTPNEWLLQLTAEDAQALLPNSQYAVVDPAQTAAPPIMTGFVSVFGW